jgi:DNA modification methylase
VNIRILIGDVFAKLAELPDESVDCVVTSPPYWGLRDYGCEGQIGMEPTLGEHLAVMVAVFDEVRRVTKPEGTLWLNYGDCYATKPNGRSAADTKAAGNDDRTFRDKPFSTVGPVFAREGERDRRGRHSTLSGAPPPDTSGRICAGGLLKPKDLCMIPNRLAIALQDAGWWVRSEIIWGKPNPMPDSSGRYRPSTAHEKIWLLTKSAKSFYDSEAVRMPAADASVARWAQDVDAQAGSDRANAGRKTNGPLKAVGGKQRATADAHRGHSAGRRNADLNERWDASEAAGETRDTRLLRNYEPDLSPIIPPEVWEIATAAFSQAHFATFPPALVVPCILAGSPRGGVILDPFGGAGTTGMVADRLGRDAILIELNPEYAELARKRIEGDAGLFAEVEAA